MVICSENHKKYINALFGQNTPFLNVQPGGSYSYRSAEKGKMRTSFIFQIFFSRLSSKLHNQIFPFGLYP
jgi:hypothetical protein